MQNSPYLPSPMTNCKFYFGIQIYSSNGYYFWWNEIWLNFFTIKRIVPQCVVFMLDTLHQCVSTMQGIRSFILSCLIEMSLQKSLWEIGHQEMAPKTWSKPLWLLQQSSHSSPWNKNARVCILTKMLLWCLFLFHFWILIFHGPIIITVNKYTNP